MPYNARTTLEWRNHQKAATDYVIDDVLFGPVLLATGDKEFMDAL